MKELIGVKDVSALLGVPTSWVYDRVRVEAIPFYKIGKYVKFDPQEVMAWLQSKRKGPCLDNPISRGKLPVSILDGEEAYYG